MSKNSLMNSSQEVDPLNASIKSGQHNPLQNTIGKKQNPQLKDSLNKNQRKPSFGMQASEYDPRMSEDEKTDLGSMMKDIDRRLQRNKNGKGSPPKQLPDKYYTDNETHPQRRID